MRRRGAAERPVSLLVGVRAPARTRSTYSSDSRRSVSHSSVCRWTGRTPQAGAAPRLRATPPATNVSST
ncbi:hypothetical protein [Streptomyces shenzhenensis]|uniref:hypothetical protein n=1 Tax=Streptomyces TaxID=1883 RepID=UPI00355662FC